MFVLTTIAALIGGTAFAATGTTNTDKNGSPTVDANTNTTQNLSYSDKSNTSPGTNAKMDGPKMDGAKMDGKAAITTNEPQRTAEFKDEDDKAMTAKAKADKMRKQKAKLAKADSKMMMNRTPAGATNDSAVNSTTGVSPGQ